MDLNIQISNGILLLFLCAAAIIDVRTRELPLLFLAAGGAGAIVLSVLNGASVLHMLLGCLPGAGLLLAARITDQGIGYGDGAILLIPGLFLGLIPVILLLFCALLAAAITGIFLMIVKKWKKQRSLPFVPFLYAGYILLLLME